MAKHLTLNLQKFLKAVPIHLFTRFLDEQQGDDKPDLRWEPMNIDALTAFMEAPENELVVGVIEEQFKRINDIAAKTTGVLVSAYREFGLSYDDECTPQEMSMRLFLDEPKAFEYAWSQYLLYSFSSGLSQFRFPAGELAVSEAEENEMRQFLTGYFHNQKKGSHCHVSVFPDANGIIVLISRGSYLKTVTQWQGGEVTLTTFRPASEDIVVYEQSESRLSVKCGVRKDRAVYVEAFARYVAHDEALGAAALKDRIYALDRIQDGTFNYDGDGIVTRVFLREAHLEMLAFGDAELVIRSSDVVRTITEDLPGISLKSGELFKVKLAFQFRYDDAKDPEEVIFEIAPPGTTDLTRKQHVKTIEKYLRDQGVKLI